jgi:hypothetical protein
MMAFDYDVFVSYFSQDRQWAKDFKSILAASDIGQRTFLDRDCLAPGDHGWEARIEQAVRTRSTSWCFGQITQRILAGSSEKLKCFGPVRSLNITMGAD